MSTITTYSLKETAQLLTAGLKRSNAQLVKYGSPAFMIWGPPGVGKSSIIVQLCDFYKWGFTDQRISQFAPTDLRGLPIVDTINIKTRWATPGWLPSVEDLELMIKEGKEGFLIFLDEVNTAPAQTQAAAYQLVLDRAVGEYVIPKVYFPQGHARAGELFPVHVLLAGNRSQDKGVTHQMPAPLLNRMGHIEVMPSVSEFVEYGMRKGLDSRVISFIAYNDSVDKLLRMPSVGERSFPTPRSWEFAAQAIEDKPWDHNTRALVASFVGEGAATELQAHAEVVSKLPDIDAILDTGDIPKDYQRQANGNAPSMNIALKWSYVITLTSKLMNRLHQNKLKDAHIDHWIKALGELEAEFGQMGAVVPLQSPDINTIRVFLKNNAFREWTKKHAKVIL